MPAKRRQARRLVANIYAPEAKLAELWNLGLHLTPPRETPLTGKQPCLGAFLNGEDIEELVESGYEVLVLEAGSNLERGVVKFGDDELAWLTAVTGRDYTSLPRKRGK